MFNVPKQTCHLDRSYPEFLWNGKSGSAAERSAVFSDSHADTGGPKPKAELLPGNPRVGTPVRKNASRLQLKPANCIYTAAEIVSTQLLDRRPPTRQFPPVRGLSAREG